MIHSSRMASNKKRRKGGNGAKRKTTRRERDDDEARATFFGRGENLDQDEEISSEDDEDLEANDEQEEEQQTESIEATRLRLAREYVEKTKGEVEDSSDEEELGEALKEKTKDAERLIADDFALGEQVMVMKGHRGPVTCACLTQDQAFSGSKDNSVLQFDLETGRRVASLVRRWPKPAPWDGDEEIAPRQSHSGEVLCLAASENKVFVGGRDRMIRVFDLRTSKLSLTLRGHGKAVNGLSYDEDLYSASEDGSLKVWRGGVAYSETLHGHDGAARCLDAASGYKPISGGADSTLRAWKIQDEAHLVYRGTSSIDACFSQNRQHYATGGDDGSFCYWNSGRKKPIAKVTVETWISAVGGIRNSDVVAMGTCDNYLRFYRTPDLSPVLEVRLPGVINAIQATRDSRHLMVAASHEHKFGRWIQRIKEAQNGLVLFPINSS